MELSKKIRIAYLGTPEMSAKLLEGLIENGFNIVAVVAQIDKPVGRKRILMPVPTKAVAQKHNIPVYQPRKIREDYSFLEEVKPDLILCFAYGQIIPDEVINYPKYGCLNFHGSLLPKYRGASPIQYALMNNDEVTGVTLMEMVKEMDAGKMYAKEVIKIEKDDNYLTLSEKMISASLKLALNNLEAYVKGELKGEEQNEEEVTFAPPIKPKEEYISVKDDINIIVGKVRAFAPHVGAKIYLDDDLIKILKAEVYSTDVVAPLGTVIKADKEALLVQVEGGILNIISLQKAGKLPLTHFEFLNGYQNVKESKFK
ncbi:MAG: methionyl-tRNA formyltransferase [Bacilli bacterium]|jgi:methionyl-tRNA formyltransferase